MGSLHLTLLLLGAVACGQPAENPEVGPPPPPPGWAERFELVRADLDQLAIAHTAKDQDAALANWDMAYHQRFEPLLERPVGTRVDTTTIVAVEYAFGRLRDTLESPRAAPVQAAMANLREQLAVLEPLVVQLPVPAP